MPSQAKQVEGETPIRDDGTGAVQTDRGKQVNTANTHSLTVWSQRAKKCFGHSFD